MNPEEMLDLFEHAARGDQASLRGLADWLEEYGASLELARLAHELAAAKPAIPEDVQATDLVHVLASGTIWRVEYRRGLPGQTRTPVTWEPRRPEENAEVRAGLDVDPLQDLPDAPAVLSFCRMMDEVTPAWIRAAFDASRINFLGIRLMGTREIVSDRSGEFVLASRGIEVLQQLRAEWRPGPQAEMESPRRESN